MEHPKNRKNPTHKTGATNQIGLILLLAIILIISISALVIGTNIFNSTVLSTEPQPKFSADIMEIEPGTGLDKQRITIIHIQGEPIKVKNLIIEIEIPDKSLKVRVKNLPTNSLSTTQNLEGDDFLDRGVGGISGVVRSGGSWEVGEKIGFRIKSSELKLKQNQEVVVRIIYIPSNSIIYSGTQKAS